MGRTTDRRFLGGAVAAFLMLAAHTSPEPADAATPHGGHRGIEPGKIHPDLWLPDTEGKVRTLSDFGGRKLLVFHFASW